MEMLFPTVKYRFCVKHIYNNFKLNFQGFRIEGCIMEVCYSNNS